MNKPELYLRASAAQNDTKLILEEYKNDIVFKFGEKVLDVGCGPGNITCSALEPILHKGTTIVGCDVSQEMIAYAKENYENELRTFRVLDISKNINHVLSKESFDKVFTFYCLHWVQDHGQALANIYQLLKEGGMFFAFFPTFNPVFELYIHLSKSTKWQPYMQDYQTKISRFHSHPDPVNEFKSALEAVDFKVVRCREKAQEHKFSNRTEFLEFMKSLNPFLDRIPADQQAEYLDDIEKVALSSKVATKNPLTGQLSYTQKLLIAIATKSSNLMWI